jgi:hypothetical protein
LSARLAAAALLAAVLAPVALGARPALQRQQAERALKTAMTAWAHRNVRGLEIGAVSCILPRSGNVIHCAVKTAAPTYHEVIVFQIRETLSASGTMSWIATSKACRDTQTGRAIAC